MVSGFRRCANIWCRRPDSRVGEEGVNSACTHEMVTHERPSGAIHPQWQPTAQLTVSAPEGLSRRPWQACLEQAVCVLLTNAAMVTRHDI